MNRHDFDKLLQKYLAGQCDEEEARQVQVWSEQMLQQSRVQLSKSEQGGVKRRLWKRLQKDTLGRKAIWAGFSPFSWSLAASVLIICVLGFGLFKKVMHGETQEDGIPAYLAEGASVTVRSEGKEETVLLEDGSTVVLGKESSIRYPTEFSQNLRYVHLEGDAFFKVAKDTSRPFLVYSGGLVTKVLGTSFNIRSSSADKIEVEVISGSVSVYESRSQPEDESDVVILTPHQKIVFDKNIKRLLPELVEEPVTLVEPEEEGAFIFEEALLADVLADISRVFEIKIVIVSSALEACRFNGDLSGLPIHTQLKLICRSVNGSYELSGNTYFLKGEGCALEN